MEDDFLQHLEEEKTDPARFRPSWSTSPFFKLDILTRNGNGFV